MFQLRDVVLAAMLVGGVVAAASAASAAMPQQAATGPVGAGGTSAGPPAPIAPETVARDDAGHVVVRAIRLTSPLRLDGKLDEAVYASDLPISGFLQSLPKEGEPATERTDAWVMFDDEAMYVAGRCWDSAPPDQWIANDMRRDSQQLRDNDNFGVMFDTFHDRRNAFTFYTNPLGALADQTFTDEGNPNRDWNAVWSVRTGRFDGGWTVEMVIPFKSLRYTSGPAQVWGVNLRRSVRRKNEFSHLTSLSGAQGGSQAWFRVSGGATLVGLDLPPASANFELKPYGVSSLATDRLAVPAVSNHINKDFGADAKYGINANLTADLTYNTDFAQVEIDEQQVNLTRFSLLFPEKREFFLEGRGIFEFGRGGAASGPPPGGGGGTSLTPNLFYSRRIGLNRGRVIPIDVGGRITGKVGTVGLGVMNIQTGDESLSSTAPTNFTVVRLKQDILKRSSVGVMLTNRSESVVAGGRSNQAYGADAAFSLFQNVNLGGYYAKSATPTLKGEDDSYQARLDYAADRYGARAEYLKVGDHFNPEVGFVRRDDIKRTFGSLRFSPRPRRFKAVRQFTWEATVEYIENGAGQLESRNQSGRFNVERENSDQFSIDGGTNYELLLLPFGVARDVTIAPGGYGFNDATIRYVFGPQRPASGTTSLQVGQFYDGTIVAYGFTSARLSVTKQLSIEPSVSINHVDIAAGAFITKVIRARTDYAFSPRMFVSGLIQYSSNDALFSSNLRLRWEYRPGSELFVVYTDERDTLLPGAPDLKNRALVVKFNRLFRF